MLSSASKSIETPRPPSQRDNERAEGTSGLEESLSTKIVVPSSKRNRFAAGSGSTQRCMAGSPARVTRSDQLAAARVSVLDLVLLGATSFLGHAIGIGPFLRNDRGRSWKVVCTALALISTLMPVCSAGTGAGARGHGERDHLAAFFALTPTHVRGPRCVPNSLILVGLGMLANSSGLKCCMHASTGVTLHGQMRLLHTPRGLLRRQASTVRTPLRAETSLALILGDSLSVHRHSAAHPSEAHPGMRRGREYCRKDRRRFDDVFRHFRWRGGQNSGGKRGGRRILAVDGGGNRRDARRSQKTIAAKAAASCSAGI